MAEQTLHPTSSQVEAAKLLVEMLEEDGQSVDENLRKLAAAQVEDPKDGDPASGGAAPDSRLLAMNLKPAIEAEGAYTDSLTWSASGLVASPHGVLVIEDDHRLAGLVPSAVSWPDGEEDSARLAEEIRRAIVGKLPPSEISLAAARNLIMTNVDGHLAVIGIRFVSAAAQLAYEQLIKRV